MCRLILTHLHYFCLNSFAPYHYNMNRTFTLPSVEIAKKVMFFFSNFGWFSSANVERFFNQDTFIWEAKLQKNRSLVFLLRNWSKWSEFIIKKEQISAWAQKNQFNSKIRQVSITQWKIFVPVLNKLSYVKFVRKQDFLSSICNSSKSIST